MVQSYIPNSDGMSAKDRVVNVVTWLKHQKFARALTSPLMNVDYAVRDFKYIRSRDADYIRSLKGCADGKRCFVIGNGPSLTVSDLESLSGEVTFASNRIWNLFDITSWRPTYYLMVDREIIAQEAMTVPDRSVGHAFINITPFSTQLRGVDGITLINKHAGYYSSNKYTTKNIVFSNRPDMFFSEGYSVTFTALQLALWMGFKTIYLIGMDHTFKNVTDSNGKITHNADIQDHCFENPAGAVINPQYREGVEFAYNLARLEAGKCGARIMNATRGGSLEVFDRINLDTVLSDIRRNGDD